MKIELSAAHEKITANLHLVFMAFIAPLVFCFSVVAPPMQAPDEWAHYAHSVQVAYGEMIGTKAPGSAGAFIPESTVAFINYFQDRLHNIPALACDSRAGMLALGWRSPKIFYQYRLIVYPPFSYMPSALGLMAGRVVGASLLTSFYLGRLCAAFAFVMLSTFAIRRATAGKLVVFALLAMPTTLYLGSSFSHDGVLIACGAFVVAVLGDWLHNQSRQRGDGVSGRWLLAFALAAFTLIVAERQPYAPLALAVAAVALTAIQDRKTARKMAAGAVAVPCVVAALWMVLTRGFVPMGDGVNAGANLKYLLRHLDQFPAQVEATFRNVDPRITRGFIGFIGSYSHWFPMYCYAIFALVLAAALLHDGLFSRNVLPLSRRGIVAVGILGAIGSVYLWALLCLTDPGNATIVGLQGRYFIIPALFFALVVGRKLPAATGKLQQGAAFGLLLAALAGIWVADVGAILATVKFYNFNDAVSLDNS